MEYMSNSDFNYDEIIDFLDVENNPMTKRFIYTREEDLPTRIRLDVCNLCQLDCAKCWMRSREEEIKKSGGYGFIKFDTFKTFIDNHPFIRDIEISNHGEIFLNPELEDIIRYAYEKNIHLTAGNGVNLNYLPERIAEALVKYQFHFLTISIDGASSKTYEIYRRRGNFDVVINNIKLINKYKEKYNSHYPVLEYKFVIFGHNQHEIEMAKKLAHELNMIIKFDVNVVTDYSPVTNQEEVMKKTGLKTLESNVDKYFYLYINGENDWFFCKDLFDNPQFDYNGDMFGCCTPCVETFGVNLFKDGLMKVLNSKNVIYAKLMLSAFSVPPGKGTPCYDCYIYRFLKKNNYPMTF